MTTASERRGARRVLLYGQRCPTVCPSDHPRRQRGRIITAVAPAERAPAAGVINRTGNAGQSAPRVTDRPARPACLLARPSRSSLRSRRLTESECSGCSTETATTRRSVGLMSVFRVGRARLLLLRFRPVRVANELQTTANIPAELDRGRKFASRRFVYVRFRGTRRSAEQCTESFDSKQWYTASVRPSVRPTVCLSVFTVRGGSKGADRGLPPVAPN